MTATLRVSPVVMPKSSWPSYTPFKLACNRKDSHCWHSSREQADEETRIMPDDASNMDEKEAKIEPPNQLRKIGLLDLPQELQDAIFDFAYPQEESVKLITFDDWQESELDRLRMSGPDFVAQPNPKHKVDDFMVCRSYFDAASRVWATNLLFDEHWDSHFHYGLAGSLSKGILLAHLARIKARYVMCHPSYGKLRSLRELELEVDHNMFEVIEPRLAWVHELTSDDLKKVWQASELERCPKLRVLKLVARPSRYYGKPARYAMFKRNVQSLEDFGRRWLMDREGKGSGADKVLASSSLSRVEMPKVSAKMVDYNEEPASSSLQLVDSPKASSKMLDRRPPSSSSSKLLQRPGASTELIEEEPETFFDCPQVQPIRSTARAQPRRRPRPTTSSLPVQQKAPRPTTAHTLLEHVTEALRDVLQTEVSVEEKLDLADGLAHAPTRQALQSLLELLFTNSGETLEKLIGDTSVEQTSATTPQQPGSCKCKAMLGMPRSVWPPRIPEARRAAILPSRFATLQALLAKEGEEPIYRMWRRR